MLFNNTKIQILCARDGLALGIMLLSILTMCLNLIFISKSLVMPMCDIMSVFSTSLPKQMRKPPQTRCFEHAVVSMVWMSRKSRSCGRSSKPGLERLQP